jgi:NAD+--dinitrogen-reductase ADP-D-ribosyltransferase
MAADGPALGLPRSARLPLNRCNLPASILGSLAFHRNPTPLALDGVAELNRGLFDRLDGIGDAGERARLFQAHMAAEFCLEHPEEAGLEPGRKRSRRRADYRRMVRGWSFDCDGREGAVLKGWVESRFGLLPRHHREPLRNYAEPAYRSYLEARAAGLYGTNGLEAQLDLLYTYCQYELGRQQPGQRHRTLFRGVTRLGEGERLASTGRRRQVVLLNNLSSFTSSRDRAEELGDYVMTVAAPLAKVFFHSQLLPGMLNGEDEHALIGGLYEALVTSW